MAQSISKSYRIDLILNQLRLSIVDPFVCLIDVFNFLLSLLPRRFIPSVRSRRQVRASWRDTKLLLRQFSRPLLLFAIAIIGGGVLYTLLSEQAGKPLNSFLEGIYLVLSLTFLESLGSFPNEWYLQLFYFLMPVVGIGILAQGLAEFGLLFFNRRQRGKEWMMAVASTFSNHTVLIGVGHLGFRVLNHLLALGQEVVVIERDPNAELLTLVENLDVPVLEGDGKETRMLELAGMQHARSIVICTQDDSLNLKIAFKARKLNSNLQVVVRIWDDDFAESVEEEFGYKALSATAIASPAFAAAAAGVNITRPLTIEGEAVSLGSLTVNPHAQIAGISVETIEQSYQVSVVLLRRHHRAFTPPTSGEQLESGDVVGVLGAPAQINRLIGDNLNK